MKYAATIAAILVIVGAVNWGLVGLAKFDLVAALFGQTIVSSIVYVLVGLAGVFQLVYWLSSPRHTPLPTH